MKDEKLNYKQVFESVGFDWNKGIIVEENFLKGNIEENSEEILQSLDKLEKKIIQRTFIKKLLSK